MRCQELSKGLCEDLLEQFPDFEHDRNILSDIQEAIVTPAAIVADLAATIDSGQYLIENALYWDQSIRDHVLVKHLDHFKIQYANRKNVAPRFKGHDKNEKIGEVIAFAEPVLYRVGSNSKILCKPLIGVEIAEHIDGSSAGQDGGGGGSDNTIAVRTTELSLSKETDQGQP